MPSIDDINELQEQINGLEEKVQGIRNKLLNIRYNSDLFLKIMKLEQREVAREQEIAKLEDKFDNHVRLVLKKFKELKK